MMKKLAPSRSNNGVHQVMNPKYDQGKIDKQQCKHPMRYPITHPPKKQGDDKAVGNGRIDENFRKYFKGFH